MQYQSLLLATVLSLFSPSIFAETVNMNKADAATFQHYLRGIGEKRAVKIINYRQANKEFQSIAEIMEVKGIGKGIFANIKADLSLTEGVVSAPNNKIIEKAIIKKETVIKTKVKKETITETVIDGAVKEKSEIKEKEEASQKVTAEIQIPETSNKEKFKNAVDSMKDDTSDVKAKININTSDTFRQPQPLNQ